MYIYKYMICVFLYLYIYISIILAIYWVIIVNIITNLLISIINIILYTYYFILSSYNYYLNFTLNKSNLMKQVNLSMTMFLILLISLNNIIISSHANKEVLAKKVNRTNKFKLLQEVQSNENKKNDNKDFNQVREESIISSEEDDEEEDDEETQEHSKLIKPNKESDLELNDVYYPSTNSNNNNDYSFENTHDNNNNHIYSDLNKPYVYASNNNINNNISRDFENELFDYNKDVIANVYSQDSSKNDFFLGNYAEEKAKFYATFAKAAKCYDKPTKAFFRGYKFYSAQSIMRSNIYPYKTFIHVNEQLNKVIVSIGGPRNLDVEFYNKIYSEKFNFIRQNKILIEKEFYEVYHTHIRNFLIKKLTKLKFEGFNYPEYVFNGHSLGGSLAIYAAYDLAKSGVINWRLRKPIVYSFGALRIGDISFATQVNKYVDVWRITKENDYLTRAPICYYCPTKKRWNCKVNNYYQYQVQQGNIHSPASSYTSVFSDSKYAQGSITLNNQSNNPHDYSNTNNDYLSKNVFEKDNKPYSLYSNYFNSAFNGNSEYYKYLLSNKDSILSLLFNYSPNYTKTPIYTNDNLSSKEEKYVNPVYVDELNTNKYHNSVKNNNNDFNIDTLLNIDDNEYAKTTHSLDDLLINNSSELKQFSQFNRKKNAKRVLKKSNEQILLNKKAKSQEYSTSYSSVAPFTTYKVEKKNLKKRLLRKSSSNSASILDSLRIKVKLMKLLQPDFTINKESKLSDLNKYSSDFVYFSPPIGRQVFYTYDGKVIQCKRTYFGASTCELQYNLPKYFYSISSHNTYLGINFEEC